MGICGRPKRFAMSCCIAQTTSSKEWTSLGTRAPRTFRPFLHMQQARVLRHAGSFAAAFWSNSGQRTPLTRRTLRNPLPSRPWNRACLNLPLSFSFFFSFSFFLFSFLLFHFIFSIASSPPGRWKQWFKRRHALIGERPWGIMPWPERLYYRFSSPWGFFLVNKSSPAWTQVREPNRA